MSFRPRLIANSLATVVALCTALGAGSADAGCLGDWLFGRTSPTFSAGYPYVAGYPPAAPGLVPVTTNNPYSAAYTPYGPAYAVNPAFVPSTGYSAGYAPSAFGSPSNSLQMPAYGATSVGSASSVNVYNNPSVYTGQPVFAGQPAGTLPLVRSLRPALSLNPFNGLSSNGSIPLATTLRGNETPPGSFYGVGNVYPDPYAAGNYQAGYAPNTVAPYGGPASALPATQTLPLFPNAPQPRQGGLARFFGSLFGTNYNSSYYRAPITYYRPVTSVDPVTGTTVTVQQPCTSYVQQLQRTPYSSAFAQSPAPAYAPTTIAPTCSSPVCGATTYGPTLTPLQGNSLSQPGFAQQPGYDPQLGYGQSSVAPATGYSDSVNGYGAANDNSVVPIPTMAPPSYGATPGYDSSSGYAPSPAYAPAPTTPSYAPAPTSPNYVPVPSYAPAPSYAPLTGSSSASADQSTVNQPRLESARPSTTGSSGSDYDYDRDRLYRIDSNTNSKVEDANRDATSLDAPQQNAPQWQRESTYQSTSTWGTQPREDSTATNRVNTPRPIPAPDNYRSDDLRNWSLDASSNPSVERPSTAPVRQPETFWNTPSAEASKRTFTLEAPPLPPATIPPSDAYRNDLPQFPSATFLPPSAHPTSKPAITTRSFAREASLPQSSEPRRVEAARVPTEFAPLQKPTTESGWRAIQ